MAMPSFIFNPERGETPASIAQKRELAYRILGRAGVPKNVGEGLSAIGNALIAAQMRDEANAAEKAGMTNANQQWSSYFGGGEAPTAPIASGAAAPMGSTAIPSGEIDPRLKDAISNVASVHPDVDPAYMTRLALVENGGKVEGGSPLSSAQGPFQFLKGTAQQYGLANPNDPTASADAAARLTLDNRAALTQALGREPTPGELYLAHQQGAGGAIKLLQNPNAPVESVVGMQAARNNAGAPGMTAGQFANRWTGKFNDIVQTVDPNQKNIIDEQADMPVGAPTAVAGAVPAPVADDSGAALPPHVELAAGAPSGVATSAPAAPRAMPSMQALYTMAGNPFYNTGQRSIISAEIARRMQQQDPKYQLHMQALRQSVARGSAPVNVGNGYLYDPDKRDFIRSPGADAGFRKATADEASAYGVAGGQFGPDGRFYPVNPPSGMSIESDGKGGFKLTQGSGAGRKGGALTEGQSKDTVYATRAEGALGTLDEFGGSLTNPIERVADYDPTGMIRGQQSPEYQKAKQAGDEFLQAILRKDTGATIQDHEMNSYGRTYLPMPGDTKELLAQKKVARRRALEAMKAGMPPEAILKQELALARSRSGSAPQAAINMLRSNPALASQFDAKYGQGAAAKILGAK